MSDWAENTDQAYQIDQPAPAAGGDFTPTPLDSSTYDSINTYLGYVTSTLGLDSSGAPPAEAAGGADWVSSEGGAGYTGGAAMDMKAPISGAGKDNATTGTGDKGFIGGLLESFKKEWGGWSDRTKAAAITVGAGLAAGLGKGYFDNKKLAIEEKQINAQTNLANTQAEIAQKKLENQKFGTFKFNPNLDAAGNPIGLIGTPAPFTPLKNRVTR